MSVPQSVRQFISQVNPFQVLPAKELDRLVSLATVKTYPKGETIYSEGDEADSVWVLKDGRIEIFKYTSEGRPLAIEMLGPKELFGTLCRLGGNGKTYPCTASAPRRAPLFASWTERSLIVTAQVTKLERAA